MGASIAAHQADWTPACRNYARTRQVLQWVFAAAPGHPALRDLCDHIALHAFGEFSGNTNRDTLERTGPGVWTDIILKHAYMHPPAEVEYCCCSSALAACGCWTADVVAAHAHSLALPRWAAAGSYLRHNHSWLPTKAAVTHHVWVPPCTDGAAQGIELRRVQQNSNDGE